MRSVIELLPACCYRSILRFGKGIGLILFVKEARMALVGPIMIVEDDADDQSLMHELLTEMGLANELISFANGVEALDYLTSGKEIPALIISDINMPLMNGIEFRRKLCDDEALRRKNIPFVFLTTTAEPVTVSIAYKLHVQGFFEKKNNYEALRHQLAQIIGYWACCLQPSSFVGAGKR
jgi:CheY-like chemotaxis protein